MTAIPPLSDKEEARPEMTPEEISAEITRARFCAELPQIPKVDSVPEEEQESSSRSSPIRIRPRKVNDKHHAPASNPLPE